jgi:hypothetical protein
MNRGASHMLHKVNRVHTVCNHCKQCVGDCTHCVYRVVGTVCVRFWGMVRGLNKSARIEAEVRRTERCTTSADLYVQDSAPSERCNALSARGARK